MRILFVLACCLSPDAGIEQRVGETVSLDATFRDESGAPVTLRAAAAGKPVVLALVYYRCPMLCNLVLNGLLQSLQELKSTAGEDFTVLTISFDPAEGAALARAKKAQYLKSYGRPSAERGWRFLSGDAAPIERLCRETGFRTVYDPSNGQYSHGSAILFLTPEGKLSRYLFGVTYPARELRLSLVEASAGKIGRASDQFLLLCMRYDPATGKYGLAVVRLLQGLAVLSALGLGVLILRLARRRGA